MTESQWSEQLFADSNQNRDDLDEDEIAAREKYEDDAELGDHEYRNEMGEWND